MNGSIVINILDEPKENRQVSVTKVQNMDTLHLVSLSCSSATAEPNMLV
ncbi:hypothetical protein [Melghirimyces algeriensis]|uniref:Uncharacterized protein n=1 Tax=Melghirimyces algeriensis TaxID=910412 RepID=A0A521DVU0_9BACL|nr:hypothetical protein [Melghirimyces algeriensis]SMO75859.1 hypothetical protein SAMN06264849_10735 [Melghirimyces algeriensis]